MNLRLVDGAKKKDKVYLVRDLNTYLNKQSAAVTN